MQLIIVRLLDSDSIGVLRRITHPLALAVALVCTCFPKSAVALRNVA